MKRFYLCDYDGNIAAEHEAETENEAEIYFANAGYDMDEHFVVEGK